ncbi:hypothetical protein LCM23_13295 [Cytobacillus kochii]|uniref:hypothetical protein n=1 Tax=Cytobacillus kochii TaxID=859143 RepID=UPI001CD76E22|nr:hypothetical protein [Cytobacillus kochii]MCA1027071.1 hypothetical protein [Cytobacillus kochii]
MKEIDSIEIVLENCESIKIGREDLGTFEVSDIKRSISRMAMNSISDSMSAEEIFIQISPKANVHSSFISTWHDEESGIKPFDRLTNHNDITAININYQNGSSEYIFVNWGGDSECENSFQTSETNKHNGDLFIAISEKNKAELYFSDDLEDEDAWHWEMYSEGV